MNQAASCISWHLPVSYLAAAKRHLAFSGASCACMASIMWDIMLIMVCLKFMMLESNASTLQVMTCSTKAVSPDHSRCIRVLQLDVSSSQLSVISNGSCTNTMLSDKQLFLHLTALYRRRQQGLVSLSRPQQLLDDSPRCAASLVVKRQLAFTHLQCGYRDGCMR